MTEDVRLKALVVDDEPRNRKLLETLMQLDGFAVRTVESGAAALAAVADDRPDVIVLDVMMPGMDGFEVVRRLKADSAAAGIPVITVTALDDDASRMRLAMAGAVRMVTKPVDRWKLKICLDEVLGERKSGK